MHVLFSDLLKEYEVKQELVGLLKDQIVHCCEALQSASKEIKGTFKKIWRVLMRNKAGSRRDLPTGKLIEIWF
jgi:hypothetical protein